MPAVARVLAGFQRDQLASFVEVAIGLLDLTDGDADLEDSGDDELTGDEQDTGWTEHHTRGRHKLASGMSELFAGHEDDEDDDPDTSVEDGPLGFDPEGDHGDEERGEPEDANPGTFSNPEAMREHRDRIRLTRCDPISYRNLFTGSQDVHYRLKPPPAPIR